MSENLEQKSVQELKISIAEITIKIQDAEAQKKADAAMHKEVIDDLNSERQELIDEVIRRRNEG